MSKIKRRVAMGDSVKAGSGLDHVASQDLG